ncbi:MAG: reverse transcriptase domain-containing protein [Campylobacterota bacterium]|nr:reverse transcriptase domain-containing protein [Campylobacterota bacterium]
MQKKDFKNIFLSYFHRKYSLDDFLNTYPIDRKNIKLVEYNNQIRVQYDLKNLPDSIKLKNYHTFLNNILFNYLKVSKNVYSYKKNSTILQMIEKHKNSKYYFKTDIESFFHSITKDMIKTCIKNNIENLPIENIDDKTIDIILKMITYNNTLAVGFTTSPSISNAILYNFDIAMDQYCQKKDIIYNRYCDDLVFSSDKKFNKIEVVIENLLVENYKNQFKLNQKKSKYLDKTNRVKILGLIITPDGHITIPKERKENIRKLLYFFATDSEKFSYFLKIHYKNSLSKAYGELNYINDIDSEFIIFLRKKYGNFVIDKFLHGDKRSG